MIILIIRKWDSFNEGNIKRFAASYKKLSVTLKLPSQSMTVHTTEFFDGTLSFFFNLLKTCVFLLILIFTCRPEVWLSTYIIGRILMIWVSHTEIHIKVTLVLVHFLLKNPLKSTQRTLQKNVKWKTSKSSNLYQCQQTQPTQPSQTRSKKYLSLCVCLSLYHPMLKIYRRLPEK